MSPIKFSTKRIFWNFHIFIINRIIRRFVTCLWNDPCVANYCGKCDSSKNGIKDTVMHTLIL